MPRRFFLTLFLYTMAGTAIGADVESRVEAVTVYPQGALVTRVATVQLTAGDNDVRLVKLVSSVDPAYLQVEVDDPGVRIGQVRVATEQERSALSDEVTALQAQVADVRRRMQALEDSSSAAQLRLTFLNSLAQGYAREAWNEGSRGTASIETLQAALSLLQSESVDANALIRDNALATAELQKDLSVLQRKLIDLNGGTLQSGIAEITLAAERAATTDIRIRYIQGDAAWSPLYEARLNSNTGELELAQQALVEQNSDEPWTGVALTLSTSQPSGELIPPTIGSRFLDLMEPQQDERFLQQSMGMRAPNAAMMVEEVVVTGKSRANVGNFAVNYAIPGLSSVPNGGDDAVSLDLERFRFDTELVTRIVPRESTQAFLTARFNYSGSVPLYGSEMRVYVDGVFAGLSEMPTALPQSEVLLPMGQDRRVEVSAKSQGGEGGRSGIIGKRKNEVTDYVFEITNRRGQPSLVEVLDRVPVARNRDIDIDVPRSATTPDERDLGNQPGLVLWRKSLDAGEAWSIRHQYTVSYPEEFILIDGR